MAADLAARVARPLQTNADLLARREAAVARGVASAAPIFADYAENAELWDVEGKRYVDFAGGIAVLNTGHRHPKVIAAAKAQEDRYTHTSFQVVPYEPYVALAEKLNALAPGDRAKKIAAGDHRRRGRRERRQDRPRAIPGAPASSPSPAAIMAARC